MLNMASYVLEIPGYLKSFRKELPDFPEDPEIFQFLQSRTNMRSSAWGLFGSGFYDMAVGGDSSFDVAERQEIALTAHRVFLIEDVVDTRVDTGSGPLEEKLEFLDQGLAALLGQEIAPTTEPEQDIRFRVSFALASLLRSTFLYRDRNNLINPVFTELVDTAKEQFITTDTDKLLDIAKSIGATCVDSAAVLTEIAQQKSYPIVRAAARHLGEYGQLLDHYYELDDDLIEGSNTYATAMIALHGDTPKTRKMIKERMLTEARDALMQGASLLDDRQIKPYKMLKRMTDFKFKIADKPRSLKRKFAPQSINNEVIPVQL